MKQKEVNRFLENKFGYKCETWYAFKVNCDLYETGSSNMSSESEQQYCKRMPKRKVSFDGFEDGDKNIYKANAPRPNFQLLHCHWSVCPKLKKLMKAKA